LNYEEANLKKRKKSFYIFILIVSFFALVVISWMVIETGIEISSHADFCSACHSMQPMVDSYLNSTHGGNNDHGVMAACTDCHVSHDNVLAHFFGKAKSGTHDAWVTLTTDISKHDWQALREKRDEYVYDSGCLSCHRNLEAVRQDMREHDDYFAGTIDDKCVNCHEEVGHSNLNMYLLENKYQVDD
jgi:cytochrome c-type protein NapC